MDKLKYMDDYNVLFICFSGINRSPTAKRLFADQWNTKAIGLFSYLSYTVLNPRLEKLLAWADIVFVMKDKMRKIIQINYPQYIEKVKNLDIDDIYAPDDPVLKKILKEKIKRFERNGVII